MYQLPQPPPPPPLNPPLIWTYFEITAYLLEKAIYACISERRLPSCRSLTTACWPVHRPITSPWKVALADTVKETPSMIRFDFRVENEIFDTIMCVFIGDSYTLPWRESLGRIAKPESRISGYLPLANRIRSARARVWISVITFSILSLEEMYETLGSVDYRKEIWFSISFLLLPAVESNGW